MAYLYVEHKITGFFKVDVGISMETEILSPKVDMGGYGEFSTEKSGYGLIWIRPNGGGVEWVSEFCPVKGSSLIAS